MRISTQRFRFLTTIVATILAASIVFTACNTNPNTNTAARLVPGSAVGFASVALSPSLHQKVELFKLSRHFPTNVQVDDKDDVPAKLIDSLLEDTGLTYEADLKPWLGAEAAMALFKSYDDDDTPLGVAYLKVKNEKKAKATFEKKNVNKDTYRFIDDYVVVIEEDDLKYRQAEKAFDSIEQVIDRKVDPLSKQDKYSEAIDAITDEHLVLGWIDTPALISPIKNEFAYGSSEGLFKSVEKLGAMVFTLYADGESLVLESAADRASDTKSTTNGELMRHLPKGTIAAADVADVKELLSVLEDQIAIDSGTSSEVTRLVTDAVDDLSGEAVAIVGGFKSLFDIKAGMITKMSNRASIQELLDAASKIPAGDDGITLAKTERDGVPTYSLKYTMPLDQQALLSDPASSGLLQVDGGMSADELFAQLNQEIASISLVDDYFVYSTTNEYGAELATVLRAPATDMPIAEVGKDSTHLAYVDLPAAIEAFTGMEDMFGLSEFGVEKDAELKVDEKANEWVEKLDSLTARAWNEDGRQHTEVRLSLK